MDVEEAIIREILEELYGMLLSHTRQESKHNWCFKYRHKPIIYYVSGRYRRVTIYLMDNGAIRVGYSRHNSRWPSYKNFELINKDVFEKIIDWLYVGMPVVLKKWKSNENHPMALTE